MEEIVKKGHPALSTVAEELQFGEDCILLMDDMRLALSQTTGVGLAANQIGITKRVILVPFGFIINPRITGGSGRFKQSKEGCLSFPNKIAKMNRESWVTVEGFDENWKPIKKKCRGLLSNIIQHEIDHLNGITIGEKS